MRNYSFFQHTDCEYFPCHTDLDPSEFNCLFCYCPLYCLGEDCGGQYHYSKNGIKDCSDCTFPHKKDHYDAVIARFPDIRKRLRKNGSNSNEPRG